MKATITSLQQPLLCDSPRRAPTSRRTKDPMSAARTRCCSLCCGLSCLSSGCLLAFMYLHVGNADGGKIQRPWTIVYAPLMISALAVLLTVLALPCLLLRAHQPSLRSRGSIGLSALATLTMCAHLALVGPPASPLLAYVPLRLQDWTAALAPLALLLLFRAATAPLFSCASGADGEADAVALRMHAARAAPSQLSMWLELLLGGGSFALLYGRLQLGFVWSWWEIAAPLLSFQLVQLVLGCMTLGSLTKGTRALPPHAKDRVEWVKAREAVAVEFGLCSCCCSLLALPALCTLAAQLHAVEDVAAGGAGDSTPPAATWAAAYSPYVFFLSLPLCCCLCCALLLPAETRPKGNVRVLPVSSSDHDDEALGVGERTLAMRADGSTLPDGSRRRTSPPVASDSSSEGGAVPLLSDGSKCNGGSAKCGCGSNEVHASQVSPHLL